MKYNIKKLSALILTTALLFSNVDATVFAINADNTSEIQDNSVSGNNITPDTPTEEIEILESDTIDNFSTEIASLSLKDDLSSDSTYATKRLLVLSNTSDFDTLDAISVVSYDTLYVLSYETEESCKTAYQTLLSNDSILSVEVDRIIETETNDFSSETLDTVSSDSELKKYLSGFDASKEIKTAILDTGIDKSSFESRIIDLGINLSSSGEKDSIIDDNGHGTEMASIIAENSNDFIKLMPIKVANNEGKATVLNTYLGIQKAIDNEADVINISMTASVSASSQILTDIINDATQKGIAVIVSAGNLGSDVANFTPANIDSAIVVSAVNQDNSFADYSNHGDTIDYSAYGSYQGKTGTSYAAANVTALIADALSKDESVSLLNQYAIDLGDEGYDKYFGNGLISANTFSEKEETNTIEESEYVTYRKNLYKELCEMNWKSMSDEELNEKFLNNHNDLIGYFLLSLSDEDLNLILSRNTMLLDSVEVGPAYAITNESEIGSIKTNSNESKIYNHNYEYFMELASEMNINAAYTNSSGYFNLKFAGDGVTDYTVKVSVTGVSEPSSGIVNINSKYALSPANGGTLNFTVGTAYMKKDTDWSGIYLKDCTYNKIKHAFASEFSNVSYPTSGGGQGRLWTNSTLYTTHSANANANTINIECNAYNCGLANCGTGFSNRTLTIKFFKYKETLKINPNGGKHGNQTSTYILATKTCGSTSSVSNPTKTGYTFAGWNITHGSGANGSISGTTYTHCTTAAKTTTSTLTAKWNINSSKLVVNPNGGSWGGSTSQQTFTQNYNTTRSIPVPTRSGYTFTGWTRSGTNGKLTSTTSAATYTFGATNNATDTLIANWRAIETAKTYYKQTVEYYTWNFATSSWNPCFKRDVYTVEKGSRFDVATLANNNIPERYHLDGIIADDRSTSEVNWVNVTTYTVYSDTVVHVNYKPNTHTLTVNPNGGSYWSINGQWQSSIWNKTFTCDVPEKFTVGSENSYHVGVASSIPIKNGYRLTGWNVTSGDGSVYIDENNANCAFYNADFDSDATVTAQWEPNNYTLTINPNGGSYYYADADYTKGWSTDNFTKEFTYTESSAICTNYEYLYSPTEIAITKPIKDGYTFTGWKITSGGGAFSEGDNGYWYFNGDYAGNVTVTAQWEANKYTLTVNPNGGTMKTSAGTSQSSSWSKQFTYNEWCYFATGTVGYNSPDWGAGSQPERTGYTFTGWKITSGGGSIGQNYFSPWWDFNGKYAGNVTVTAQWEANKYTLTLDANGGSFYNPNGTSKLTTWNKTFTYNTSTCFSHMLTNTGDTNLNAVSKPSRTGYTFTGWKITSGGGSATENSNGYWNFDGKYAGNVTVTAQWEANTYTQYVNHYKWNPNSNQWVYWTQTSANATYGSIFTPQYTNTPYGYYNHSKDSAYTVTGSTTKNAYYYPNTYTVTLNKGTGISSVSGRGSYLYGKNVTVSATLLSNTAQYSYIWEDWSGTYNSSNRSYTFTMPAQNVTLTANGKQTINQYTVTYIDVVGVTSGKQLGKTTKSINYGTSVRGSDLGSNTEDNIYYNGYYYVSDTSATVTTSGATVHRIFKQRKTTISGNINWIDWNNKNSSRPDNVTLHINGSDGSSYEYTITGNNDKNTSTNSWPYSKDVPKYDSNGNVISYTITQDKAISKEEGIVYKNPVVSGYNVTNETSTDPNEVPVLPKTSVTTNITWMDNSNQYNFRPNEITVSLLQNGTVIETITTSATSYIFKNLYKYDRNGDAYKYTITSNDVDRYTKSIDNARPYIKTITYTFQTPTYSVIIPKTVVLDGKTGIGEYTVSVKGTIDNRDNVKVIPDGSFTMSNESLSDVTAIVKQTKNTFTNADGLAKGTSTTATITADTLAGEWNGSFNFKIAFEFGS